MGPEAVGFLKELPGVYRRSFGLFVVTGGWLLFGVNLCFVPDGDVFRGLSCGGGGLIFFPGFLPGCFLPGFLSRVLRFWSVCPSVCLSACLMLALPGVDVSVFFGGPFPGD